MNNGITAVVGFDSEWSNHSDYYLACLIDPANTQAPVRVFRSRTVATAALRELAPTTTLAIHNAPADFATLGFYPKNRVLNTLVLSWLHDENGSHKLKDLAPRVLGRTLEDPIHVDEKDRVVRFRGKPIEEADQAEVEAYCIADAQAHRDLALHYWKALPPELTYWYSRVEERLDRCVYDMERRGVQLDVQRLLLETTELHREVSLRREEAYSLAGYTFNIDSNPQLANILYTNGWETKERGQVGYYKSCTHGSSPPAKCRHGGYVRRCTPHPHLGTHGHIASCAPKPKEGWVPASRGGFGLQPRKLTDHGQPSTDDDALSFHNDHPFVQTLLSYREHSKVLGTYLQAFPRFMKGGRLYGRFNSTGTVTGRFSSSKPNLQNIPSRGPLGQRVRRLFIAKPGHVLVQGDLDQIEYRLLAAFSGDRNLLDAFASGVDVHLRTAELVGGKDRQLGKTLNYAAIFGAGPGKVASLAGITSAEASDMLRLYYEALPAVSAWKEKVLRFARTHGHVVTLSGRRRHLPNLYSNERGVRAAAERQAVNCAIQGSAADIMRAAMVKMHNLEVPLILTVHDEVVAEVPSEDAVVMGAYIVSAFKEAAKDLGITRVAVTVEPKVVTNWAEAKAA